MGRLHVVVGDEVEREFRKYVALRFGFSKGALGKAVEEALKMWVERMKEEGGGE